MRQLLLLVAVLCLINIQGLPVDGFSFANSYGSNMVLHAAPRSAVVWGTADNEFVGREIKVIVTLDANPVKPQPVTGLIELGPDGRSGTWKVVLPKYPTGGPYTLTAILSTKTIQLKNILFGEVWLCSGAVNMGMETFKVFNGTEEINGAKSYGNIRLFTGAGRAFTPQTDIKLVLQPWTAPDSDSVSQFSSLCWMYGRKLHEYTKKPIGLVFTSGADTFIEYWSSPEVLAECNTPRDFLVGRSRAWNGMIHPLLSMTITGGIWYQADISGEGNANYLSTAEGYDCIQSAMIRDWRQRFHTTNGQTDALFPFGIVQIGGRIGLDEYYPSLRWKQTAEQATVPNKQLPNTFMAVAMDLPDLESPWGPLFLRDKPTVAERLMLGARAIHLAERDIEHTGPVPAAYRFDPNAETLEIKYNTSGQLERRSNDGFEVCCSSTLSSPCEIDDIRWTKAPISKSDSTTITLTTSECQAEHLLGHRYAWALNPCEFKKCAVYGAQSGLPGHMYKTAGLIIDDAKWHPIEF